MFTHIIYLVRYVGAVFRLPTRHRVVQGHQRLLVLALCLCAFSPCFGEDEDENCDQWNNDTSPVCVPPPGDPLLSGIVEIRGKSPSSWNQTYSVQVENQNVVKFKVVVDNQGRLRLLANNTDITTYYNIEFDAFPISGNLSYSRNLFAMEVSARVALKAANYFGDNTQKAALMGPIAQVRPCFLPKVEFTLTQYPKAITSYSLDMGPSLQGPWNLFNLQLFKGWQQTVTNGGDIQTLAMVEVDPKRELCLLKKAIKDDAFPDVDSKNYAQNAVSRLELLARNGSNGQTLGMIQYIRQLDFILTAAISTLDKFASTKLVQSIPQDTYFYHRFYPDSMKDRERDLQIRGEALYAAADEVLKTFICKFPRGVRNLPSLVYYPLIMRYRNACHELGVKFKKGIAYPYYPESPNGQEIVDLLDSKNEGAPLFYHLAEQNRYEKPLYKVDGSLPPPTDRCADESNAPPIDQNDPPLTKCRHFNSEYTNGGIHPSRPPTLDFINRMATDPTVARDVLKFSGLLFPKEVTRWETSDNLDSDFLEEIMKRWDQGGNPAYPSGISRAWIRWNGPYFQGKQVVMADMAQRYLRKFDSTSPIEFLEEAWLYKPEGLRSVATLPRDKAINYCLNRGMGLPGEFGDRGFLKLVKKNQERSGHMSTQGPGNVLPLWIHCNKSIWMEMNGGMATQWDKTFWPTSKLKTHVIQSFLKYPPAPHNFVPKVDKRLMFDIDYELGIGHFTATAGTICVGGEGRSIPVPIWENE